MSVWSAERSRFPRIFSLRLGIESICKMVLKRVFCILSAALGYTA